VVHAFISTRPPSPPRDLKWKVENTYQETLRLTEKFHSNFKRISKFVAFLTASFAGDMNLQLINQEVTESIHIFHRIKTAFSLLSFVTHCST
jgi:hypothetical protein